MRGNCLNICRFEPYRAREIEIYVLQTTLLFSVVTHFEEVPASSFVRGYPQAERSVSITMSCRFGLVCLTSVETKGSLF